MDVDSDVVAAAKCPESGVHSHAHPDDSVFGPGMAGDRRLRSDGGTDRIDCRGKTANTESPSVRTTDPW